MSLSFQKLEPVCVKDPRTIVANKRDYAVLKSGSQTTWKQYSTTAISVNSLQFSCPPPSGGVFVDRKMYAYVPVRLNITVTSTAGGQTAIRPGFDAPRAFPLSSAIETLQSTINNQSASINLADIIHPLMRYNTCPDLKNTDFSTTPTYLDASQAYSSLTGTNKNPLGAYGDSGEGDIMPRGGFPFVVVANPVSVGAGEVLTAVVDIAMCEPLFLSPYFWGKGISDSGFFNVTSMDFNITFLAQSANRFWSRADGGLPATLSYVFGGLLGGPTSFSNQGGNSPFMLFNYITPQETQVLSPQLAISYPYFDVQRYPTDQANVPSGTTTTIQSNNIQLSSIPRRMYVYVRERNQDLYASPERTDTYFAINNLSIQFQNKNGLLSSASAQQLYQMSVKNHCNMSWTEWSGGPVRSAADFSVQFGSVGSVVCIEFATDIGLDSLDAPGKLAQSQLQVQVNCTNRSNRAINPTLYIVTVLEGTFTIEGLSRSSTNIGVISSQDVLDCQNKPQINYESIQEINGGNFLSGLKKFGKWLTDTHVISDTISKIPGIGIAAPAIRSITGLGYNQGGVRAGVSAGSEEYDEYKREVKDDEGGVLVGGKSMSRKNIAKKLMY